MKKWFILFSFLQCIPCTSFSLPYTPNNTIIAADLDDVVVESREYNYYLWLLNPLRWLFTVRLYWIQNKFKIYDGFALADRIAQEYPHYISYSKTLKSKLIECTPLEKTIAILRSLKESGYTIIAATNMSDSVYQALIEHHILPSDIFSTSTYFTATNALNRKSDGSYYKKPSKEYFKNLQIYLNNIFANKFNNIVFIDDKVKNVHSAQQTEITALHFTTATQLEHDLAKMNILPTQNQ